MSIFTYNGLKNDNNIQEINMKSKSNFLFFPEFEYLETVFNN